MTRFTRRKFVFASLAVLATPRRVLCAGDSAARFGMVTDSHYADSEPRGTRYYRESLVKMRECVESMNEHGVEFLIELGDFKDEGAPPEEEETLRFLEEIEAEFARFAGPRYHALGNHDIDSISKQQFLSRIENTGIDATRTYYSFDCGGVHFVILDANFRGDGTPYDRGNFDWTDANVPDEQIEWLRRDLATSDLPAIVFVHQRLDGEGDVFINNAAAIRDALEASGKTLAVFQGHHHAGGYSQIEGIHYYTLKAVVEGSGLENSAYAIVEIQPDRIVVAGYRRALSRRMDR